MITGYMHTVQLSVFIKSVGMGFIIGILFSAFAFFNTVSGKRAAVVFLRDVLFFVSAAVLTFMFILEYNAGILRFYIFAGELIGFILFYIYPLEIFRRIFSSVYNFIHIRLLHLKHRFLKRGKELFIRTEAAVKRKKASKNVRKVKGKNTDRKRHTAKMNKSSIKRKKIQKNG